MSDCQQHPVDLAVVQTLYDQTQRVMNGADVQNVLMAYVHLLASVIAHMGCDDNTAGRLLAALANDTLGRVDDYRDIVARGAVIEDDAEDAPEAVDPVGEPVGSA
jgi:hypothetical protein